MSQGIATVQLSEHSLSKFLGFAVWREEMPLAQEPCENDRAYQADIRNLLGRTQGGFLDDVPHVLKKPLAIAAMLGRATREQYSVLSGICDAMNTDQKGCVASFAESEKWTSAIQIMREHLRPVHADTLDRFSRSAAVAKAIRNVEAAGFSVRITSFGPVFDAPVLDAICSKIGAGVKRLGGRSVIDMIYRWFAANKRHYHGSLLYGRLSDQLGNPRDPSIPWHFLFNLALRHFNSRPTAKNWHSTATETVELARNMAAVMDTESYTVFETVSGVSRSNFHQSINDRVLYDELFAFQQWQPEVAPELFGRLVDHLVTAGVTLPLASADQWKAFANSILKLAPICALTFVHPSECVSPIVNLPMANQFFSAFSIPQEKLNGGYATPQDTAKRNAPFAPFYAGDGELFVLPARAQVARGLYEAFYRLLREAKIPELENHLGDVLEILAADAVEKTGHRPSIERQKYHPSIVKKGKIFDVDAMDLTARHVLIVECKKKALTGIARGGNSLAASLDMARAFFYPLVQMNRHEQAIRGPSGLMLANNKVVRLEGRHVHRLAITMTDHGSMQDRPFQRGMVLALRGATLSSVDPSTQKSADEINKYLGALSSGTDTLAALSGEDISSYLMTYTGGCWWFGIDQLFFLCSRATDLWSAISPIGGITYGSGDIMTELSILDRNGFLDKLREGSALPPPS